MCGYVFMGAFKVSNGLARSGGILYFMCEGGQISTVSEHETIFCEPVLCFGFSAISLGHSD